MCLACGIFHHLGAFHSQFMTFGPSEKTEFMAMKIDTWPKWHLLALFSFLNTTINEFIGSALVPWFTNTIQDQKTKFLDHDKATCMMISLIFDVYTHVMSIFGIYLMFSQIDFLLIRMVADCLVTSFTTMEWVRFKKVDKARHDLEVNLPPTTLDQRCDRVQTMKGGWWQGGFVVSQEEEESAAPVVAEEMHACEGEEREPVKGIILKTVDRSVSHTKTSLFQTFLPQPSVF